MNEHGIQFVQHIELLVHNVGNSEEEDQVRDIVEKGRGEHVLVRVVGKVKIVH